jgi:hypothetical protein
MPAHRPEVLSFALRSLATAIMAAALAGAPARAAVLEPGAAHAAAHLAAAEAYAERIAATGDAAALLRLAHDAQSDSALPAPARERVLYLCALALADADVEAGAEAATDALLALLAARPTNVEVWQYDGPARFAVPLYDVAAAARYAQRRRVERRAIDVALAGIARGSDTPLAQYDAAAGAPAEQRAILAAFAHADADALLAYRDRLYLAAANGTEVGVAALVAGRLADVELMRAALEHADAPTALDIVRGVRTSFPEAEAVDLLAAATTRADVGSAALLEIGRLAASMPRARALLFAALAQPASGGSAAAALGAAHDPDIAAELLDWVRTQQDVARARRGVLALRLDASPAARAALAEVAGDPKLAAPLRTEALK